MKMKHLTTLVFALCATHIRGEGGIEKSIGGKCHSVTPSSLVFKFDLLHLQENHTGMECGLAVRHSELKSSVYNEI